MEVDIPNNYFSKFEIDFIDRFISHISHCSNIRSTNNILTDSKLKVLDINKDSDSTQFTKSKYSLYKPIGSFFKNMQNSNFHKQRPAKPTEDTEHVQCTKECNNKEKAIFYS